ncbi:MAG: HAMP domain-containing histidine kinase [Oscillospiraceae bacterium]|nr:HAMP domain-containing histidine kinase [Oscillospiraceae bacterium]
MKDRLKRFFGSIYFRFPAVFICTFMLSLLIPAFGANVAKAPKIEKNARLSIAERAENIKRLTDNHEMSVNEAAELFIAKDAHIEIYETLSDCGITLTEEEMRMLASGKTVLAPPEKDRQEMFALFETDGKYVLIRQDRENGPMGEFMNMQIFYVAVPMALGMVLIILASVTVAKPIKQISRASQQVAKGDLSVRLTPSGSGEIRELAENFNSMVRGLSQNEYLHKEFVSNVSHEFGTPITSLKGYAKLMKRDDLSPEKRAEYADIIISESERLSRLSSDLLKLSELENKGSLTSRQSFSLDEQLRSVIILLQNSWESKALDLDVELDETVFYGDESLLYQVWVNLVSNAVRYTERGGKIRVALEKAEDAVTVSVSDNGKGLSEEEAANVFRRFYKADKSRGSQGTGLGLSIAKRIAELHGGDISVSGGKGVGTTFTVTLPVVLPDKM